MKKYLALILTFALLLVCFTACKPSIKEGAIVTEFGGGQGHAAVTEADGGVKRDDAGNLIVLVTDENGRQVKDENGEYQTNPVAIDHALIVGNTIEMPEYSIQMPNGWSNLTSYEELIIQKDGTSDVLKISVIKDESYAEILKQRNSVINLAKSNFENVVTESKAVTIGETEGTLFSAYVPDANGAQVYMCYIVFEHNTDVYSCMFNSNTDASATVPEIVEILNTIEYIY